MNLLYAYPAAAAALATYLFWWGYLAAMNLDGARRAGELPLKTLIFAMPGLAFFYVFDVLFNWTLGSTLLADRPRWGEWTLSQHLARLSTGDDWRARVANTIGKYLLHRFDPTRNHYD